MKSMKPKCQHVKPNNGTVFMSWGEYEEHKRKGDKQRQCPVCKLWFWEAEYRKAKKP